MGSRVKSRIEKVISRIVGYVQECLPQSVRIQLLILNLKMGADGKIWFLYCNSLKLYDASIDNIHGTGTGRDAEHLRPNSARLVEASIPPPGVRGSRKRKGLVCPSTDTRLGPFDKYKVPVHQVMIHFLWHGTRQAWAMLGRVFPPNIPLEHGNYAGTDGVRGDILRFFVTMDLRPPPVGLPFVWNAPLDDVSRKQSDVAKWSVGMYACMYVCMHVCMYVCRLCGMLLWMMFPGSRVTLLSGP
jgi:hypothetical protein